MRKHSIVNKKSHHRFSLNETTWKDKIIRFYTEYLVEWIRSSIMKRTVHYLLFALLVVSVLTACNLPVQSLYDFSPQEVSKQFETVSVLLTKTASSSDSPGSRVTVSPTNVANDPVSASRTPEPAVASISITQQQKTSEGKAPLLACDIAHSGKPIDVTIPDDTQMAPGATFSKTWRLINAGNCTWTTEYALVWFSGDDLALTSSMHPLDAAVAPGSSVEITVDMVAPEIPGTYQSNWKIRSAHGQLFGIGPNGDSPFWVRIVVLPDALPTETPIPPTATQPAIVFASGSLVLELEAGADLDSGQVDQAENDDLAFENSGVQNMQLAPENGARISSFGDVAPDLEDCNFSPSRDDPVIVGRDQIGSYLCYRTTEGLPGRVYLSAIDEETSALNLEFVTWSVP